MGRHFMQERELFFVIPTYRLRDVGETVELYDEFKRLRDRLKGLEELGIIERNVIAVMPPWVEYELTAKGHELGGALRQLENWGRSHMCDPV